MENLDRELVGVNVSTARKYPWIFKGFRHFSRNTFVDIFICRVVLFVYSFSRVSEYLFQFSSHKIKEKVKFFPFYSDNSTINSIYIISRQGFDHFFCVFIFLYFEN